MCDLSGSLDSFADGSDVCSFICEGGKKVWDGERGLVYRALDTGIMRWGITD